MTSSAENVVAGWLGQPAPLVGKQRNQTRANYRKTKRRRPQGNPTKAERRMRGTGEFQEGFAPEQLELVAEVMSRRAD